MDRNEAVFGEATCMICGEVCDIVEYINTPIEMWCYCKKCDIDTFHKPLNAGVLMQYNGWHIV